MRVMDASVNEIRVESLVELSKVPVDTGVRRMCQIALGMCKDSLRAFIESDKALGNAVISIDDEVDNFSLLLLRLIRSTAFDITLASQLGLRIIDCFDYMTVVQNIERVADYAINIARCVQMGADDEKQFSRRKTRLLTKLGSEAFNAYEMAVRSFFARDMEAANGVTEVGENLAKSLEETIGSIAEEKQPSPLFHLYIVMNSLHRIAELGQEIAEATMNSAVCKLENNESHRSAL
jgi:Na+/phosphate symporter